MESLVASWEHASTNVQPINTVDMATNNHDTITNQNRITRLKLAQSTDSQRLTTVDFNSAYPNLMGATTRHSSNFIEAGKQLKNEAD